MRKILELTVDMVLVFLLLGVAPALITGELIRGIMLCIK